MCRAESHARDSVEAVCGAVVCFGVGLVVVAEAVNALEDHVSGLVAYGAVCGAGDGFCGLLDGFDSMNVSFAVDEVINEPFELRKADAAGDAFSAGLCCTEFQVAAGEIQRTESGGCADYSAFEIFVKRFYCGLSFCFVNYAEATQNVSLPRCDFTML